MKMTLKNIKIGTRLELELLEKDSEEKGTDSRETTYVSQLLDHSEDGHIIISAPIYEARLKYIALQEQIRLTFVHIKYGLLGFDATVTGREFRGNIAVLIVQADSELMRMQRRTHFRLDYVTDVLLWPDGKGRNGDEATPVKAFSKNISGSGICVVSDTDISIDSQVDAEFKFDDTYKIFTKCSVVRNTPLTVKKLKSYELGLHYIDISEKDQENIIRYIFKQQQIRMKERKN